MLQLKNIGILSTYNSKTDSFDYLKNCNIDIENGIIIGLGESKHNGDQVIDCNHKLVTPGFVDAHTHPVFVNGREKEFIERISGKSYQEISNNGGGINTSIIGVREIDEIDLLDLVIKRMDDFINMGTTTIEAKTGYGLDTDSELKSLRVLENANNKHKIDILPTFLGDHSIPNEYNDALVWNAIDNIYIPDEYDDSEISTKLTRLAIDLAALQVAVDSIEVGDTSDLQAQVAELAGQLSALSSMDMTSDDGSVDLGPLIVRIATVEGSMTSLKSSIDSVKGDIRTMKSDITTLERQPSSGGSQTIENRYDEIKVKIRANKRLIINAVYEKGLLFIIIASLNP